MSAYPRRVKMPQDRPRVNEQKEVWLSKGGDVPWRVRLQNQICRALSDRCMIPG